MHAGKLSGDPALHLSLAQGLRLALYKGLHATEARPVQRVAAGQGPTAAPYV